MLLRELLPNEAGESPRILPDRAVFERVDARDFRSPCAEDGRPGGLAVPAAAWPAGGDEGDQGFPARSASSYTGYVQEVVSMWDSSHWLEMIVGIRELTFSRYCEAAHEWYLG